MAVAGSYMVSPDRNKRPRNRLANSYQAASVAPENGVASWPALARAHGAIVSPAAPASAPRMMARREKSGEASVENACLAFDMKSPFFTRRNHPGQDRGEVAEIHQIQCFQAILRRHNSLHCAGDELVSRSPPVEPLPWFTSTDCNRVHRRLRDR